MGFKIILQIPATSHRGQWIRWWFVAYPLLDYCIDICVVITDKNYLSVDGFTELIGNTIAD